jgi:hypothetical protein
MARQQGASQAAQDARRNALIQAQVQQQQLAIQEMLRQQRDMEEARQFMRQAYQTPQTQAASMPGGPTRTNAAMIPQMPGGFNPGLMRNMALQAGNPSAVAMAESLQKGRNIQKVGANDRIVDLTEGAPKILVDAQGEEWVNIGENGRGQILQQNTRTKEIKAIGQGPLIGSISVGGGTNENKFVTKLEELQAAEFHAAQQSATEAQQGNNALARIKGIVAQGGVTGGPLATIEVTARNLASQIGMPVDKVLDKNNAMYSAEASARIAEKIIKGGRALTDSDVARLREAFPGYGSGIPTSQLPAFIAQLETINNERIANYREMRKSVNPALISRMPMTFTDVPGAVGKTAQPNPAPSTTPAFDDIMKSLLGPR